ncbi:PH domain-containing protein [Flavobacterium sp.]|uniref:PH domain-containing protein n=1 Tax=Flavobacterium sp. TaxID=239 RepID=UPI002A7EBA0F|nr:PH domain-containing protein [Flavobacterium sp.]
MTYYKSAFSTLYKWIMAFTFILIIGTTIPLLWAKDTSAIFVVLIVNGLTLGLLLWLILQTNYVLDSKNLFWKSGPFKGTIAIDSIKKIEFHKGVIVPVIWKPAMSHVGLIITYNNYDDIYISPENRAEFVQKITILNPNINLINQPA